MADYHREPVTDRRLQHAHSSFDSMEDFVEIIEHPMAKTTGHSGSGLGNQSKWFFRGPISLAPRNLVLNSPLKVRKTRENLRVMRPGNRDEKERDVPKLGVEKIPPQDIWSTPVPKLQGGASGILLASKLSVPANIETIGTGFPDTTVGDQNPQARLQRSQSLRQRVVTKVRKFSYKTKSVVSLSHALHGGPPSRQTSSESRHSLISEFEPDITSTPIKMEKLILGSDQQHSSLVSPPSIAFSSISPEFAGNGLFSTPPSPPDGTATNGLQVARRGPVQHSKVTLRAVLSIRPEVDCIDMNSDEAIWASVKIKGDALVMTASQHLGYPVPSLAVAVVIDNSSFTSKPCLESACDQALNIAKLLRSQGDQIAVYATTSHYVSDGVGFYNSNEIYAMGSPNFTVLRRKLDNLQAASSETVYAPRLEVILLQAADDLQQLNFNHSIDVLTAQREIILIAPHSIDISNQIPELEGIRLNLITSGIIPLRVSPHVTGWCLNTVYPVPSFSRHGQDEKDMHANDLAALISTARFASHPGTISNLFVDIIPGPETVVEKIIGAKSLTKLLPGQSTSLLLKLRVKSVDEIIRNRNPEFFGPTDNVASLEDAFTDLEVILGELLRELVTVTISYKHSNFPDNTDLTVKEKCWIRRTSALQIKRKGQGSGIEREMVQKALALALASRSKPQSGLRGLQRVFDDPTFTNTIPLLVALLKDELEFQANALFERNFIQNLHRQHMATYMPAFDRVRSSLELNTSHTHQRAYAALASPVHHSSSASVHRHQPSNEYADAVQNTEATGPVRFYAAQNKSANEFPSSASVQSTETTGPLRFWRNLRQVSKGKVTANSELAGKDDSFEEEGLTEKMAQIRKEALKNKRSIGTDTLRSMARSLGRGGESSSVKVSRIAEEAVEEKSSSSST